MDVAERIWANPASLPHGGTDAPLVPADPATGGRERMVLNLFFEERDNRWFPGDRHIRPLLRRMLLGKSWISGQRRVFLNLCAGLDRVGIRYRVNDYGYIRKHPQELACIIGRPFVLDWFAWKNPLLLGVAMYNHPMEAPERLSEPANEDHPGALHLVRRHVPAALAACRGLAGRHRDRFVDAGAAPSRRASTCCSTTRCAGSTTATRRS